MREQCLAMREELVKLAEENEKNVQTKCAQHVLAASGLTMLREKIAESSCSSSPKKKVQKPLSAKFNLKQYQTKKVK